MSSASGALLNIPLTAVDLMTRARHGDGSAYSQIVRLYQDRLYNSTLRLVGDADEAAEVTQEAFTRGRSKIADVPAEAHPYTWLFRIALNIGVSALRRSRRRRDFASTADEAHRPMMEAMGRLESDYRAALVMRDVERFDYEQMADVLGLPLATVKSRLFRARLALRDEMKD